MTPARDAVTPDTPLRLAYRLGDAAERLGVHRITLWRWVRDGKLPSFKIGSLTFIPAEALEATLAHGHPSGPVEYDTVTVHQEQDRIPPPFRERLATREKTPGTVYLVGCGPYVKIGFTNGPVAARMADIQTAAPEPLVLLCEIAASSRIETALHRRFAQYRSSGEWFRREGVLATWIRDGARRTRLQPGCREPRLFWAPGHNRVANALSNAPLRGVKRPTTGCNMVQRESRFLRGGARGWGNMVQHE